MIDISTQAYLKVNSNNIIYWGDTEQNNKFYLWPEAPRFRRDENENGKPVFSFYKYTQNKEGADGEMKGGYLTFDAEFALDASVIDAAKLQIAKDKKFQDGTEIIIGTIPYTDGSVHFTVPDDKGFVTKINTDSKPSLSGRNIATVAVELTPSGATLFYDALTGKTSSILQVAYQLKFNTLLPAATVNLKYSASRTFSYYRDAKVDTHSSKKGNDYHDTITQDVIEKSGGKCDVEFGSGVSEDLQKQVREWALTTYKDMVQKSVFDALKEMGEDKPGAGDKEKISKAIKNSKDFDMNYKEKQTINYCLEPKGTIENLLTIKGNDGTTFNIDKFFKVINLDDNFFDYLNVKPNVHGLDWNLTKLADISVTLDYGKDQNERRRTYGFDTQGNLIKTEENPFPFTASFMHDSNNKPIYDYYYSIAANFNGSIPSFKSGMLQSKEPNLSIGPSDLNFLCVSLQTSSLIDWDKIKSINFDIECQGIKVPTIEFNKNVTKKDIAYPIGTTPAKGNIYEYTYTITYNMSEGTFKASNTSNQYDLIIPDFASETITYTFIADEDPTVHNIFLTLEYEDNNNKYKKRIDDIDIYKCENKEYNWKIPVIDVNGGDMYYSGDILYNDGKPIKQIPRTKASSHRVQVYQGAPKLELEIYSDLINWDKYQMVVISLEYIDEVNNVHQKGSKKFTSSVENNTWVINIADLDKQEYSWSGQFITKDQKVFKTSPVKCIDNPLLIVPPQV